jgi:hypothetical protein
LGSLINDEWCALEIKYNIDTVKTASSWRKSLFASKLDLNLRMKLEKCYIWIIAFYGALEKRLEYI